jgi:hypothetical protein
VLAPHRAIDEGSRIDSLLRLIPPGGSLLEIGARNGYMTRSLARGRSELVALDLQCPRLDLPGVTCVAGDARALAFEADRFDVVLAAEVLEHIPPADLAGACGELARVARRHVVIGVPFAQDLRVARTRCAHCGTINPAYGHVNRFLLEDLGRLFHPLRAAIVEHVGRTRERTNSVSDALMRMAGYPWGSYGQDEPCIACGESVGPAPRQSLGSRILTGLAHRLDLALQRRTPPRPKWLHVCFDKPERD